MAKSKEFAHPARDRKEIFKNVPPHNKKTKFNIADSGRLQHGTDDKTAQVVIE